jgi:ABC-2 type transport system permease protein
MFARVRQMLIKEFIQVFRDPRMWMVIFVTPCIQVLVTGYAVSTDVTHVPTGVFDLDNSSASRDVAARFANSGYFDIVQYFGSDAEVSDAIDRGQVGTVLRFNRGFADDLRAGRTARLQVIVDGADSNTAGIVMSYVGKITAEFSRQVLIERFERLLGGQRQPGRPELRTRAWFNDNLESRNFYVPGVLVIVVTLATLLLTSMAVVREKELGTIEQIMVTPITPAEFILGKTVPFALIGFADVIIVTLIVVYWFEVPMRGNPGLLLLGTALYLTTTLGTGLLISTISQTQQQAMMSTFFFFFPAMLLSGFSFPIANMPRVVQWLTYADPLRYFLVIVRGIFLKGVGIDVLWPDMLALGLIGTGIFWLAVKRFHKTT